MGKFILYYVEMRFYHVWIESTYRKFNTYTFIYSMKVNQSSSFCTISYVYNIWISRKFYIKSEVIVYFLIKLFLFQPSVFQSAFSSVTIIAHDVQ